VANEAAASETFAQNATAQESTAPAHGSVLTDLFDLDLGVDAQVLGATPEYTIDDVAQRAGVSRETVEKILLWFGQPSRNAAAKLYTQADVDAVGNVTWLTEALHLTEKEISSVVIATGYASETYSRYLIERLVHQLMTSRNIGDTEARFEALRIAPKQTAKIIDLVTYGFRRAFATTTHQLTTDCIARRGVGSEDQDAPFICAIGVCTIDEFSDRVASMGTWNYANQLRDFRSTAWNIINTHGGHLLRYNPDNLLYVSATTELGARTALELCQAGVSSPTGPVRVGLTWGYCTLMFADALGTDVTIAERLADAAAPSEALISPMAGRMLFKSPDFRLSPQQQRAVEGFDTLVPQHLAYA
jgi:class 3 adenylate cyclase